MSSVGFELLLVSDGFPADCAARVAAALAALPPGFAAVQLRAHDLGGAALYQAARALGEVTRAHAAALLVNDRADVALAAGADGVHLPVRGLGAAAARRLLGPGRLVGASAHSLDEAHAAWQAGADYVTFGPVYPTASKAAYGAPVGVDALARVAHALAIPVFALGGVTAAQAAECRAAGARLACIGAGLGAPDPAAAVRALAAAYAGRVPT